MVSNHHPSIRFLALFVGAVVVGSVMSDLDHIVPPFHPRSWSDNWYFPLLVCVCLGVACYGRQITHKVIRMGILKTKNRIKQ